MDVSPGTDTVDRAVHMLSAEQVDGQQVSAAERIDALRVLAEHRRLPTLEPFLPILLNLNGDPYTLKEHFPFRQLFMVDMPQQLVMKTGRQVSKTTSLASHGIVLSNSIPHFSTLYVTPLFEQIRRFSNNYVKPFVDQSPVKSLMVGSGIEQSVLQRSFRNYSKMIFSFALLDADRIRGIQSEKVAIDEIQDMDRDHIPIIQETMSYAKYGLTQYTGTPKSLDNTLEGLWQRSSQAEWWIPCHHCTTNGRPTWNIPSIEYHLEQMIGPLRDDISEDAPATICHKCRQPINPRGLPGFVQPRWRHRYPERCGNFDGYHVPQILLPHHYASAKHWSILLGKREHFAPNVFQNEVLGESCDFGQKLVSLTELKHACQLPWNNNPAEPDSQIDKWLPNYVMRAMGVDWGGGGEKGVSYTVLAVMGLRSDGVVDVLWAKRIMVLDPVREANECLKWFRRFRCEWLAHDYTGAGIIRETTLIQAGVPIDRVMPIAYVRAASKDILYHVPPTETHRRHHWRCDKTRSLATTTTCIRLNRMRFFKYDYVSDENPGLMHDFLALTENKTETRTAGDIYSITAAEGMTDDFAHAVNLGSMCLFYSNQAWPNFARAAASQLTDNQIAAAGNRDYGWEQSLRRQTSFYDVP